MMTTSERDDERRMVRQLEDQLVVAIHETINATLEACPECPEAFEFCVVNALLHAAGDSIAIASKSEPATGNAMALYVDRHAVEVIIRSSLATMVLLDAETEATVN